MASKAGQTPGTAAKGVGKPESTFSGQALCIEQPGGHAMQ